MEGSAAGATSKGEEGMDVAEVEKLEFFGSWDVSLVFVVSIGGELVVVVAVAAAAVAMGSKGIDRTIGQGGRLTVFRFPCDPTE